MKPQWVDIQVNGRHGVPLRSPSLTVEQVIFLTEKLRDEGTAAYVSALTTTTPPETAVRNVRVIVEARRRSAECARRILGIHFEGPFISSEPGYAGAHAPASKCCLISPYKLKITFPPLTAFINSSSLLP